MKIKIIMLLLRARRALGRFFKTTWDRLKRFLAGINWQGWLIIALVLMLAASVAWAFHQRGENQERLLEARRVAAELEGQIEIHEGLIFTTAREASNLGRQLSEALGENSKLKDEIQRLREDPEVLIKTEVIYRDRVRFVSDDSDEGVGESEDKVETHTEKVAGEPEGSEGSDFEGEGLEETENHIVKFDLVRNRFRLLGQTETVGPRVDISLEQIEPFEINAVVTRERRSGAYNLYLEDPSGDLDFHVQDFAVDDSIHARRFLDRLGFGGTLAIQRSYLQAGLHGSIDIGPRASFWAGPTIGVPIGSSSPGSNSPSSSSRESGFDNSEGLNPIRDVIDVPTRDDLEIGGTIGFTFRPFVRRR